MMVVALKHAGTTACLSEMLKMSVKTSVGPKKRLHHFARAAPPTHPITKVCADVWSLICVELIWTTVDSEDCCRKRDVDLRVHCYIMKEHKMANRDPKMKQQRATMARRRRMAIMQGRVKPGASCKSSTSLSPTPSQLQQELGGEASKSPQESRRLSIQRCIQSLVHACQCRNANCSLPSCQKMKRVLQHTKNCKRKTNGGCPVCKQLIALCCYHARHCQENKCPVPFCLNIKQKLRLLRWRRAAMQGRVMQNSQHPPAA